MGGAGHFFQEAERRFDFAVVVMGLDRETRSEGREALGDGSVSALTKEHDANEDADSEDTGGSSVHRRRRPMGNHVIGQGVDHGAILADPVGIVPPATVVVSVRKRAHNVLRRCFFESFNVRSSR